MDLDDLLGELFGDSDLALTRSRRLALVARMILGLAGATLFLAGAYLLPTRPDIGGTPAMRVAMAAAFAGLGASCVFNVMLGRRWKWPWLVAAASFIALFASRLAGL